MADTIPDELLPDVDEVVAGLGLEQPLDADNRLSSSAPASVSPEASASALSADAQVSECADVDGILDRLEAAQSVADPALGAGAPRGSAHLHADYPTVRPRRNRAGTVSRSAQRWARRPVLVLSLLAAALIVVAAVLGVTQFWKTGPVAGSATSSVTQSPVKVVAMSLPIEIPVLGFGSIGARIEREIDHVADTVRRARPLVKKPRRKPRARHRVVAVAHTAAATVVSTIPATRSAVTPSVSYVSPSRSVSSSSSSHPSTIGKASSSVSSPESLSAQLGGIQGKGCNPTCR